MTGGERSRARRSALQNRERHTNTRFFELDGIRAIAVLMVIFGHYTLTYDQLYPNEHRAPFEFRYGAFGVQLFFLVSGFVILMSAERVKRASDFAITRFSRLFPAYWVAVTWSILVSLIFSPADVANKWSDRLLNYLMLQRWLGVTAVDTVYWTLAIEMQFYLFVFILLWLSKCRLKGLYLWMPIGAWLFTSLMTAVVFGKYSRGHSLQATPGTYKLIFNLVLTEYAPLFCTGMFAFMARRGQRKAWAGALLGSSLSVVVAYLMHGVTTAGAIAVLCTFFLCVAAVPTVPLLRWAGLQWIGRISYSLYLVHNVTGLSLIHRLTPSVGRVPAMLLAFFVSCLLASCLYKIAEVRGTRLFRTCLTGARDKVTSRRAFRHVSG